jgi:hypothetical protein
MHNVLVVYSLVQHPPRGTLRDALKAFDLSPTVRCYYLNLAVRRTPRWLTTVPFDAVVFHATFLSARWNPPSFDRVLRRAERLRGKGRTRVALPQDEFLRSEMVESFVESFDVDHIFSVGPAQTWPQLYPEIHERVGISQVLTGYLHPETVARIDRVVATGSERPIDVGYRAWHAEPWLGRHGALKVSIAEAVERAARARGLRVDISTRASDTIAGEDWYRFLASCKYTIGVEGGASVHDADGSIKECSDRYVAKNPGASFNDVEAACFAGRDGEIDYRAISPRHLEACATRTCQVLVEGDYNGVLAPGRHYVPLRADMSNLDEVLDVVQRDTERERLVGAAYADIVASGAYTYERLVRGFESVALKNPPLARESKRLVFLSRLSAAGERLGQLKVAAYVVVGGLLRRVALRILPDRALDLIRRRLAGTAAEAGALHSAD